METRITTLIENSQGEHLGLETEHGISFLVEKDGHKVLFDTGQSGAFIGNAGKLGLTLDHIDFVAVSHGHYDHSGGIRKLVEMRNNFTLITGRGFFGGKYATDGIFCDYIGNDFDRDFLEEKGIFHRVAEKAIEEILPGIYVLTAFPRLHKDEIINRRFAVETNDGMAPDDFADEILIAVETGRGFIILLGCSHPGLKNMLDAASSLLRGPLYAVMGGTHLVEATEDSLTDSIRYLKNSAIDIIGLSHCTGPVALQKIKNSGAGHFKSMATGRALIV